MKQLFLFVACLLFSLAGFSQPGSKNTIVGIVYKKNSEPKIPIIKAYVAIPGVGSATTDNAGSFAIGLSQCGNCITGKSLKIYVNSDYGYGEADYVIPIDPNLKSCEIPISPNQKMSIHGIVMGQKPGSFLSGIKVTAIIQNYDQPIPPVYTDKSGYFNLIIRKEGLGSLQAIQLVFNDEQNAYQSNEKVVFINQFEPVKVTLAACPDCGSKDTLKIGRDWTSSVKVEKGDLVKISASGLIKVGEIIGTTGPEGVPNNRGIGGFSLGTFNYFPNWNHGALVFRVGTNDQWKCFLSNSENAFQATESGFLEFGINDKIQSDNSGYFTVVVTVKK